MRLSPVSSGPRKIRTPESSGRKKEKGWHLCSLITNSLVREILLFTAWIPLTSQSGRRWYCAAFLPLLHFLIYHLLLLLLLPPWVKHYPSSIAFLGRFLRRTSKHGRSDADDTRRHSERLGGIPLRGDGQRGPSQPGGSHRDPGCAR